MNIYMYTPTANADRWYNFNLEDTDNFVKTLYGLYEERAPNTWVVCRWYNSAIVLISCYIRVLRMLGI